MRSMSLTALRRLVIGAQGYAPRVQRAGDDDVEATIERLAGVQLDSISTVERSHRIALAARAGIYPKGTVSDLLRDGRVFEYWGHEACLLPVDNWPLFRQPMAEGGRGWFREVERTHPHLADEILEEIRARGPLGSRHFEGTGSGGMWNWKPAKAMLDRLWNRGELVIAGRQGFQRLYDLPERVLPQAILDAPAPSTAERLRELTVRAVRARGALTESGIVEHWRLKGGVRAIRSAIDEAIGQELIERVAVDDGLAPVFVAAGTDVDDPPFRPTATLLSPFDNLLWDRPFARRVLDFDHLIEVYKPAPERRYGYYVLPFLWRDRLVGRADIKADRSSSVLRVHALHLEVRVRQSAALEEAFDRALDRLRRAAGLVAVVRERPISTMAR